MPSNNFLRDTIREDTINLSTVALFTLQQESTGSKARTGIITTDHGPIETPIFMPVGTQATVKGVHPDHLKRTIQAQIILGNTYHLFLRPGMDILRKAGGLHAFMDWDRPILTDSGGYQIFSLSGHRTLKEKGAYFSSHLDGSKHLFTPENVVDIQRMLGSDIIMTLDECPPYPSDHEYAKNSMELTHRWAKRGRTAFLSTQPHYKHRQAQFGIIQGGTWKDLRTDSTKQIVDLDFEGNAIGGLSVGEPVDLMLEMTDLNTDLMPKDKPRYLMGVGTPANLLQCIALGIDMFDCVMPTRNARNGTIFTWKGRVNLRNAKWKDHHMPLDESYPSDLSSRFSMSYIHHLFRANELLGMILASHHNLAFYLSVVTEARKQIEQDSYHTWYPSMVEQLNRRI